MRDSDRSSGVDVNRPNSVGEEDLPVASRLDSECLKRLVFDLWKLRSRNASWQIINLMGDSANRDYDDPQSSRMLGLQLPVSSEAASRYSRADSRLFFVPSFRLLAVWAVVLLRQTSMSG